MRPEKKIPTIFALLILFFGLGGLVTLINRPFKTSSLADAAKTPHGVKIANITDSSVSISWVTDGEVFGSVAIGEGSDRRVESDDRDREAKGGAYHNHHVTIHGLIPANKYTFRIISGDQTLDDNGKPFTFTTATRLNTVPPAVEPSYGKVVTQTNDPAKGALVYLSIAGSSLSSTLVKDSGEWLIPLSAIRTIDGTAYLEAKDDDQIELSIRGDDGNVSTVVTDLSHDAPVPVVTLGKIYNFRLTSEEGSNRLDSQILGSETTSQLDSQKEIPSIGIIAPPHNSALTSTKPLIRGTGIAGKIVRIVVESAVQIGEVTVGNDGLWSWAPQKELSPGSHTITMRTTDDKGKAVVKTGRFIVLKSGSQVLGEATPSGTISPTATPLPTAVPTLGPTTVPLSPSLPTPTPVVPPKEPLPRSGNSDVTLFLLTIGAVLFVLGVIQLGRFKPL